MSSTVLALKQQVSQINGWPRQVKFVLYCLALLLAAALIIIIALGANVCSSSVNRGPYNQIKGVTGGCRSTMARGPKTQHCYDIQRNSDKLNWIESQEYCRANGGNLITLHTLEEVEWMIQKMVELQIETVYLGLYAAINRTKWLWLDDHSEADLTVTSWAPGQPDHWNGLEYCGSTYRHMNKTLIPLSGRQVLNDVSCETSGALQIGFICKIPL